MKNQFLTPTKFKHNAFDYSLIDEQGLLDLIKAELPLAIAEIEKIAHNPEKPTFENTIEALERSTQNFDQIANTHSLFSTVKNTPELEKMTPEFFSITGKRAEAISLNDALFQRVKTVYEQKETLNLDTEQKILLTSTYNGFIFSGANLPEDKKKRLSVLDEELSLLQQQFCSNQMKDEQENFLHFEESQLSDFKDIDKDTLNEGKKLAKEQGKTGLVFNLQSSGVLSTIKDIPNRKIREQIYNASNQIGNLNNSNNNLEIINKVLQNNFEQSTLLGYKNLVDFTLQDRMDNKLESITGFLQSINSRSKISAQKIIATLNEFAQKELGLDKIYGHDLDFVADKYTKRNQPKVDEEILFEHFFPLEHSQKQLFKLLKELFGMSFKKIKVPVYHKDVVVYEVFNEEKRSLGLMYLDLFSRKYKSTGAQLVNARDYAGLDCRQHVVLSMSITKSKNVLLNRDELSTLYHEMGHGIHMLASNSRYNTTASESVKWDFVELPSQIMENWIKDPVYLQKISKHWETGAKLNFKKNAHLLEKDFLNPFYIYRRSVYSLWDLFIYGQDPKNLTNFLEIEKAFYEQYQVLPVTQRINYSTSFDHLFGGGYSAGFYCYLFAEMLDSDAFSEFQKVGLFDKTVGRKYYKEILEAGSTREEMDSYKAFTGRLPSTEPFFTKYQI